MDIDGTLTDGKIYVGVNGEAFKAFNVKDGYGISALLPQYSIIPIVITGRTSEIVKTRCNELNIPEIHQGCKDKYQKLMEIVGGYEGIKEDKALYHELSKCAYIGDDIPDLKCMKAIKTAGGIVGCPKDAVTQVIHVSDFVATKSGGEGAVREFIDFLLGLEEKEMSE